MAFVKGQPFKPQFDDGSGNLLNGGTIEFQNWDTSTATNIYSDSDGTPGGTSVTLNSRGEPSIDFYYDTDLNYKMIVKDSAGVLIYTLGPYRVHNPVSGNAWVLFSGTPTQTSTTTFTLTGDQTSSFTLGTRCKFDDSSTLYGIVTASAYTSLTTVTVKLDSGSLSGSLSAVYTGLSTTVGQEISAETIIFNARQTGSVNVNLKDRLSQIISVKDFGAVGGGATNDTAAIQAAIDYTKTFVSTQNEIGLVWPAGDYNVTSLNFVGCNRVRNIAIGTVNIYGTQAGGTSIINVDGSTTTPTNYLFFDGNFSAQIKSGTYQYGVYMSYCTQCQANSFSVSGAFSVNSVYINYSWDNPQLNFVASNSSGTAIATIELGNNNVNRNRFNCRTTGSSDMGIASIGMRVRGNTNVIEGDFSSSQIGLDVYAARGTTIISPYHEINKYCIQLSTTARGTVILGGSYEIGSSGAAFNSVNSQHTTIISPYMFGISGGSSRTAFILGSATYGLTVLQPDFGSNIDTVYTGTWRGEGGFTQQFNTMAAQWIGFPGTQVSSSDVNTLDDYEEGTWTPAVSGVTLSTADGNYTKIGNVVTLGFLLVWPSTADVTAITITGLPFAANGANSERNGLGVGYNSSSVTVGGVVTGNTLVIRKTGDGAAAQPTNADFSTKTLSGSVSYLVAT